MGELIAFHAVGGLAGVLDPDMATANTTDEGLCAKTQSNCRQASRMRGMDTSRSDSTSIRPPPILEMCSGGV